MKTVTVNFADLSGPLSDPNKLTKMMRKAGFDLSGYRPIDVTLSEDQRSATYSQASGKSIYRITRYLTEEFLIEAESEDEAIKKMEDRGNPLIVSCKKQTCKRIVK